MLRYTIIFIFFLSLLSCGGTDEESSSDEQDQVSQDSISTDTSTVDTLSADEENIFTGYAAIDGPGYELWIFQPGAMEGEVTEKIQPEHNVLHFIPFYPDDPDEVSTDMANAVASDFSLYDPFKEFTGPVTYFYDKNKNKKAAEFEVENGQPQGIASVYQPDGAIFLQYRYDNGKMTEAIISPYSHDWKFYQSESKLVINDPVSKGNKNADGLPQHKIARSLYAKGPGDNSLSKVMEKESFNHPFTINGDVFTGTLLGYWGPYTIDSEELYYELNFTDGWLDGDVKIYSEWFGLTLHERFVDGELDSTIMKIDEAEMDGVAKPIVYLYPEKEQHVTVKLDFEGEITHTYPKYDQEWKVVAKPDGTLLDASGKEYYALYWEGDNDRQFSVREGFCVPGEKSAAFLEESLDILGLNRREANEFIVYWLPVLEKNPYNLIHFATDEYEQMAKLSIQPEPETLIRVMMVYQPLGQPVAIPPQDLSKYHKERKGFTVVEWGGSLLKAPLMVN